MERYRGIISKGNRRYGTCAKNSDAPLLRFHKGFPVSSEFAAVLEDTEIALGEDADLNEFGMTIDSDTV